MVGEYIAARGMTRLHGWMIEACALVLLGGVLACTSPTLDNQGSADRSAGAPSTLGDSAKAEDWYLWTDDGVRHYVVETGQGPTVVVLHGGWGAEHSYLLDVVTPLADRFHFVLYDQRGSLRSPAPDDGISLERLVADLEELREEIGVARLTLLAHSMGTQLAYAYHRDHPDRVQGLVLMGAVLPSDAEIDEALSRQAHERFVAFAQANEATQVELEGLDREDLTSRERSARWRISMAAGNIYHVDRWRRLKGGQAFYNDRIYPLLLENSRPEAWGGMYAALQEHAPPTFLIMGDHDLGDFGLVAWPDLVETLPNARLFAIPRAGHNVWIDEPETVAEHLVRALSTATQDG